MSRREKDTTRKGRVDENAMKLDTGDNNGEYKVEAIWDSTVYARKSESAYLPGFYYLVSWKRYLEEENTWEPASAAQHLRKLISLFYKDYLDKPTATSPTINTTPPMARPIVRPTIKPIESSKQKQRQSVNSTNN